MRRVSEGPLEETQLREASTHLLNGQAAVDFKRRHFRSRNTPLSTTLKNLHLTPLCVLTSVASRISGTGGDTARSGITRTLAVEGGDR